MQMEFCYGNPSLRIAVVVSVFLGLLKETVPLFYQVDIIPYVKQCFYILITIVIEIGLFQKIVQCLGIGSVYYNTDLLGPIWTYC
jgi:hypothetical protein